MSQEKVQGVVDASNYFLGVLARGVDPSNPEFEEARRRLLEEVKNNGFRKYISQYSAASRFTKPGESGQKPFATAVDSYLESARQFWGEVGKACPDRDRLLIYLEGFRVFLPMMVENEEALDASVRVRGK